MKFFSLKRPPKVQSVWGAVLAGMLAHPLFCILLTMVYWVLRPFVWAAIYSEPYRPPPGQYLPDSGEWLFVQGIGFCASMVSGALAAYWSPPKSKLPIALLGALNVGALLFTQFPFQTSACRNALYALHTPFGILIGAIVLLRCQATGDRV